MVEACLKAHPEVVDFMKVYRDSEAEHSFVECLEEAVVAPLVVRSMGPDHMETH